MALGSQLMTVKGWAAPEVERAYARARTLCQGVGDTPQLFPALWGLWLFSWGRGEVSQAKAIADACSPGPSGQMIRVSVSRATTHCG
jgi:predicted ATPase